MKDNVRYGKSVKLYGGSYEVVLPSCILDVEEGRFPCNHCGNTGSLQLQSRVMPAGRSAHFDVYKCAVCEGLTFLASKNDG